MDKIENIEALSANEKLRLRLNNFLKIKFASYALSAAVGISAGSMLQKEEREMTGYDPVKHDVLIKDIEKSKGNNYEDFKSKENEKKKKVLKSGMNI